MPLVSTICPQCGATMEVSDDRDIVFCSYCGAKIINQTQKVELNGNVSVGGIANKKSLIERAFLFIEDGNFERADQYFEKVLNIDPKHARAYIGKLLCRLRLSKIEELSLSEKYLTSYDEYNKAIRFANGEEFNKYQKFNTDIISRIEKIQEEKENEISDLQNTESEISHYPESHKSEYQKNCRKKVSWEALMIISIFIAVVSLIATIVTMPLLIIIEYPIFTLWIIFTIIKEKRCQRLNLKYNVAIIDLQKSKFLLSSKQQAYQNWLAIER